MKEIDKNSVGYRIRSLRTERGIKQKEFAEMLGVAANYIGTIERGIRTGSETLHRKIANIFGVSYSWLVGEESAINPNCAEIKHYDLGNSIWEDVNLGSFFYILKANARMTDEEIAKILEAEVEDVQAISAGENRHYDNAWGKKLSALARKLDIFQCSRDMELLHMQLLRERVKEETRIVQHAVYDYLKEKAVQGFRIENGDAHPRLDNFYISEQLEFTHMDREEKWVVWQYVSQFTSIRLDGETVLPVILYAVNRKNENPGCKIVTVMACTEKEIYDQTKKCLDANAMDIDNGIRGYDILLLYINACTGTIENEDRFSEEDEKKRLSIYVPGLGILEDGGE